MVVFGLVYTSPVPQHAVSFYDLTANVWTSCGTPYSWSFDYTPTGLFYQEPVVISLGFSGALLGDVVAVQGVLFSPLDQSYHPIWQFYPSLEGLPDQCYVFWESIEGQQQASQT